MSFNLPHVPKADEILDDAFRQGAKEAKARRSVKAPFKERMRESEEGRVKYIGNSIQSDLRKIVKRFPSYDQLSPFHKTLLEIKIDKDRYKKSLGAAQWCLDNVSRLKLDTLNHLKEYRKDTEASRQFQGRVSSMVKKISKDLDDLIEIKKILREFPVIEDLPTMVVCGYPNVGKSTFMKNLTGSEVKIASYPFTTQSILIGHTNIKYQKYQIIDSPGLLDRAMEQRNKIELEAVLALKELADVILFIVDPSQDLASQVSLLKEVSSSFEAPVFVAVNKSDITPKEKMDEALKEFAQYTSFSISANNGADCVRVFQSIFKSLKDAENKD
jgi:nucleolar GTP-binding protein